MFLLKPHIVRLNKSKAILLASVLCAPFCVSPAHAATRTWDNGAGTTNWFTATNWNADFVPTSADSAYINNGTVAIGSGGAITGVLRLGNAVSTTGSLTVTDSLTTAAASIAYNTTTNHSMTLTGPSAVWSLTTLEVGRLGTGQLTISAGAVADASAAMTIGTTSTGTVTVTGTNSRLFVNSGTSHVGSNGTGTLNILAGGTAEIKGANYYIGYFAGSTGSVVVNGAGSKMITDRTLRVGNEGTGTLLIENSGKAEIFGVRIANVAGSNGTVTVTGAGSTLTSALSANFYVGTSGTGRLEVLNGGVVTTNSGPTIGHETGSTGFILVSGANSLLNVQAGNLNIGYNGTGTLTVANNGSIVLIPGRSVNIGVFSGGRGTLNIGADAVSAAATPGSIVAEKVVFIEPAGVINFNHTSSNYDFASAIIGTGTINFMAGTTNLTGDLSAFTGTLIGSANVRLSSGLTTSITTNSSTFAGTTTVNQNSLLSVNGSLGGTVVVDDTGRLQGNSQLGTVNVLNGGTVAPGNSIGTTNVVNTTFNPGSIYEVEVNSAGQSDLINASGTATLNGGTVRVIPLPDAAINTPYTILTAAGGVTGAFDGVESMLFLRGALDYSNPNTVFLTLNADDDALKAVADTPNQKAVAALAIADPASNAALAALLGSPDIASAREAFNALSGEAHATLRNSFIRDQSLLRRAVYEAPDTELASERGSVWMQGFGLFGKTDGNGNAASSNHDTKGMLVGVQKNYEQWHAGVAGGYGITNVDVDDRGSKADSKDIHVMAYGGTDRKGGVDFDGGVSATWHDIDTRRDIQFSSFKGISDADYHAATTQVFAGVHKNLKAGAVTITPFARGAVIAHRNESFTEDGEAGLRGESRMSVIGQTTLGIELGRDIHIANEVLSLNGSAGWQHMIGETDPGLSLGFADETQTATMHGAPLDDNALVFGFDVGYNASQAVSVKLGYDGAFAPSNTDHAIRVAVKVAF